MNSTTFPPTNYYRFPFCERNLIREHFHRFSIVRFQAYSIIHAMQTESVRSVIDDKECLALVNDNVTPEKYCEVSDIR